MRNKKILTIVIVFIVVLCITGGVLAYLFLTTSAFKSDKEMFLEERDATVEADGKKERLDQGQHDLHKDVKIVRAVDFCRLAVRRRDPAEPRVKDEKVHPGKVRLHDPKAPNMVIYPQRFCHLHFRRHTADDW